ncbi:MAG: hypothetical protein RMK20_09750, partial [Verrucomicrobiales bacterium]|nr:hypothetical protein [Verrucomicrobiales bacterium]
TRRHAALETTGLVLKLYRHHFGTLPVHTTTEGLLDAQAAWSSDRKRLTLGVVNLTGAAVRVPCQVQGARLRGGGRAWRIAHADLMAFNDPEQPPRVGIEEIAAPQVGSELDLPAHSVTLISWEATPHLGGPNEK